MWAALQRRDKNGGGGDTQRGGGGDCVLMFYYNIYRGLEVATPLQGRKHCPGANSDHEDVTQVA